jgi:hypothetical protein
MARLVPASHAAHFKTQSAWGHGRFGNQNTISVEDYNTTHCCIEATTLQSHKATTDWLANQAYTSKP